MPQRLKKPIRSKKKTPQIPKQLSQRSWNILAILGFILSFTVVFSVVGFVLCIIALAQIKNNSQKGKGLAISGIVISLIICISLLVSSIASLMPSGYVRPSGVHVEKTIQTKPFTKIQANGNTLIVITFDKNVKNYSVVASGDENILKNLEIKNLDSSTLRIQPKPGSIFPANQQVKIEITTPAITDISLAGLSQLKTKTPIESPVLRLSISGAGTSDLALNVSQLYTTISGTGMTNFFGSATNHNVVISGAGTINSYDLNTEKTDVTISGLGEANVRTSSLLKATVSGSGIIRYKGSPQVIQNAAGTATIIQVPEELIAG